MTKVLLCLIISIISLKSSAQIIPFTVDPVKKSDFSPVSSLISPGTEAVVLQESGETVLDATPQNGFFTKFHYFKRLLILNKNGLEHATDSVYYNSEMLRFFSARIPFVNRPAFLLSLKMMIQRNI